jgi:hypothetical protein
MAAAARPQAMLVEVTVGMLPAAKLVPVAAALVEAAVGAVAKVPRRGPVRNQRSARPLAG